MTAQFRAWATGGLGEHRAEHVKYVRHLRTDLLETRWSALVWHCGTNDISENLGVTRELDLQKHFGTADDGREAAK
jgi:hypothetical protein